MFKKTGPKSARNIRVKIIFRLSLINYYCTPCPGGKGQITKAMTKKQLFTLEYPVRCSPSILYEFLATSNGLQEWFADKVDDKDNLFVFTWNGNAEKAEVVDRELDKFIRFHWINAPKEEYFEFRIEKTEVSNQTILVIKDYAEKGEIKDQTQLWDYQVKELFHRLGN